MLDRKHLSGMEEEFICRWTKFGRSQNGLVYCMFDRTRSLVQRGIKGLVREYLFPTLQLFTHGHRGFQTVHA